MTKAYGHTVAARDVSLVINAGEMVAIAGHNGAGKSTLAKIIGGVVEMDEGKIAVDGVELPLPNSVQAARASGVALAFQEITLFPDLRVFEHAGAANPAMVRRGWRRHAASAVKRRLDEIFPSHGISSQALVASLSLAQRQMMQIVLATMHQGDTKLLILDEPTSSLSDDLAEELFAYLHRERRERGLSVILVSHKIADILNRCDRTIVMRDGAVVSEHVLNELSVRQLMTDMGAAPTDDDTDREPRRLAIASEGAAVLEVNELEWRNLGGVTLTLGAGEIVGLAGLEANGQQDVLEAVWRARRRLQPAKVRRAITLRGTVAYVSGDRQKEGLLALWTVAKNITIGKLRSVSRLGFIDSRRERKSADRWIAQMTIKADPDDQILSLSGGNQQKVLLARGLSQAPKLLILDDPFRGVDITSKAEAYRQLQDLADGGASILWYTSENRELLECDRVYVLRGGECSAVLSAEQLNAEQIILASFGESTGAGWPGQDTGEDEIADVEGDDEVGDSECQLSV